jgi:hypothetical protein
VKAATDPEILHECEKPRATVRAYINEFHGKRYAHIREFVEPRDEPGAALVATRAGVCVEIDDLDELQPCIDALTAAVAKTPKRATRRQAA